MSNYQHVFAEISKGKIMIEGVEIIVVFDVGHLDKCDRNNLLTKHLEIDFKEALKNKNM